MKSVLPGRVGMMLVGGLSASIALSGCSAFGHKEPIKTVHYQCGTLPLTVTLQQDVQPPQARFLLDGERLQLPLIASASGEKYSNGRYTFWTKGDHAFVQRAEQVIVDDCLLSPAPR